MALVDHQHVGLRFAPVSVRMYRILSIEFAFSRERGASQVDSVGTWQSRWFKEVLRLSYG